MQDVWARMDPMSENITTERRDTRRDKVLRLECSEEIRHEGRLWYKRNVTKYCTLYLPAAAPWP